MGDFRDRLRRIRQQAGAEEERRAAEKAEEASRARETTDRVDGAFCFEHTAVRHPHASANHLARIAAFD